MADGEQPSTAVTAETARKDIDVAGAPGLRAVIIHADYVGGPPPPAPAEDTPGAPQLSSWASVSTLCNSAVGAGVLSLPVAFAHAGLVGGLVLCLLVGVVEAFTLYILSKFAERYNASTYGVLVRRSLGKKLTALLAAILMVYLWGACVVYLIIVGDTFSTLGRLYLGPEHFLASRNHIILLAGVVLAPLCLLRRIGHLAWLSTLAVVGFIYTCGVVLVLGAMKASARWPHPLEGVPLIRWDLSALFALPIVCFGFNCHCNVVSIFSELTDEAQSLLSTLPASPSSYRLLPALAPRPGSVKLINMLSVILIATTLIGTGYVVVGSAGLIGWPDSVSGNILNSLPLENPFVQVAQALIGVVVLGHYPLNHHPARSGLHDMCHLLGVTDPPALVSDVFTLIFVASSVGVSLGVTSLGSALHIIGGTAASFIIFFLPGLMLINSAVQKQSASQLEALSRRSQADETEEGEVDPGASTMKEPLLRHAAEKGIKGIKRTGLVYSPAKSWAAGVALVLFSLFVLAVTLATLE